jgi:hypothetical protein
MLSVGIFGSFKKANEVWGKSEKEVKDARKNDELAKQRGKKSGGKK